MRVANFNHEFVEYVPRQLEEGVLYVSIAFATAVHRCACGCGNKVVTPISPADWQITFDGDTVSLTPSIGNWAFPCRSHYIIRRNRVVWAPKWTRSQIEAASDRDQAALRRYFASRSGGETPSGDAGDAPPPRKRRSRGWVARLLRRGR